MHNHTDPIIPKCKSVQANRVVSYITLVLKMVKLDLEAYPKTNTLWSGKILIIDFQRLIIHIYYN